MNRDLIDGYLGHLAGLGVAIIAQKCRYTQTKPVLLALGRRGLIPLVTSGDAATFPRNPFSESTLALSPSPRGPSAENHDAERQFLWGVEFVHTSGIG